MEKGEGYVIFASEATWMEEKTSYLITDVYKRQVLAMRVSTNLRMSASLWM